MVKKKSRRELAREIIAHLRQGMNRPSVEGQAPKVFIEATPFLPVPYVRSSPRRARQLLAS